MGHGRRSRSRSRDRSKAKAKSNGSSATTSSRDVGGSGSGGGGSGGGGGGGGSRRGGGGDHHSSRSSRDATGSGRGGSRSRSRDRDRKVEASSSTSRRDEGRDRDRDRDRDRHHHRDKDRKSRRSDRDGDRDRDRDRKRSRRGGKGEGGEGDRGNPDDMWKRKLRDEDEQLKELDVDALLVDEEEEERRLEEQRRKRKEKLEALRRKKTEDEKAKAEAAVRPAPPPPPASSSSTANDNASPPLDRESPPSLATNGRHDSEEDPEEEDDDDAGPIEITKQGTEAGDTALDEGEDESGGQGSSDRGRAQAVRKGAKGNGIGGVSSSELEVQQGKEDRPVFDMFSAASLTAAAAGAGPGGKMGGKGGAHGMSYLGEDGGGDQGNWTDVEGYYKTRVGEVIGGRYTVLGSVGQGVFSTVLKCLDTRAGPAAVGGASEVALKMIRNNDIMRKAAQKEVALLKELAEHDPANRKHCIRMLGSLEHKQHVVMVFESMQMNLRETLNKFGRKTGINIHAVQKYGKQLLAALKHMASRNLVHADIKPDNILVDQGFGSLKLADFGSAFRESDPDNDPTPYLVSRYYRAPEIVMGLEYDKAIDLWSVAVTLFELYKGSVVLPGVNNNQMLKRMMDFKGPVPTRMIKNHLRAFETMGGIRPHFTEGGQFMQQEPDPVTGQTTVRLVTVTAPSRPVKSEIMRSKGAQDKKDTVADLADFLDKCMSLDPRQRASLEQCSAHSFLRR